VASRITVENEIIALIEAAVADGVTVGSLPQGKNWEEMFRFPTAAVWTAYAGCVNKPNQAAGALVQAETWTWSVLVFGRNYRSPGDANEDALTLLETVVSAVAGNEVSAGLVVKEKDGMVAFPKQVGVVAYEAVFSVQTYLRRTS
jgi:hypothetical protein